MDQYTGEGESDFQATDTQKGISIQIRDFRKATVRAVERSHVEAHQRRDDQRAGVSWLLGVGYRTPRAIAWVTDVGVNKPAWLARYKAECCGPSSLKDAKAATLVMAKGAVGDYRIENPIEHLERACGARLLDTA